MNQHLYSDLRNYTFYITNPGTFSDHQTHIFNYLFLLSLHWNRHHKINISKTELLIPISKRTCFFYISLHLSKWQFCFSRFSGSFSQSASNLSEKNSMNILLKIYPQIIIPHYWTMTTLLTPTTPTS